MISMNSQLTMEKLGFWMVVSHFSPDIARKLEITDVLNFKLVLEHCKTSQTF
jgi:hypothetical protein